MRRLPPYSEEATEEIWERLDAQIERAREKIIEPARERLEREVELRRESLHLWDKGELFRPEHPVTVDVFVAGFPEHLIRAFATRIMGLGLTCNGQTHNADALAMLSVHHARVLVWNADNQTPGSFYRLAMARQPHLKGVAIGNTRNRTVFERLQRLGAAAFVPNESAGRRSAEMSTLERCVIQTTVRRERVCPNFEEGHPCRGECASFEDPPRLTQLKRLTH